MTKIEWTERTWNPIVGCSIVSPGCTNCYAMRMAARIERMGSAPCYDGTTKIVNGNPVWTGLVRQASAKVLTDPLRVKRPTMWFVNSMSDLFHEDIPDEWIDRVFEVMGETPEHTYQILTKRASRMRAYMNSDRPYKAWNARRLEQEAWPARNVWLGVSTERQQEANERVPHLLATPAAVRFVSAEPLLGPINFTNMHRITGEGLMRPLDGRFRTLDWIIVGGESGPGARPFHVEWARDIVSQCQSAAVACFVKQIGAYPVDTGPGSLVRLRIKNRKGGDPTEWPKELRVRQMPTLQLAEAQ